MYPQVSLVSAAQAYSAFLLTIFLEQLHGVCGDLLKLLGYCGKAVEFFGGCSSHHSLKLAATYNLVPWLAKRECRSYLCCLTCKLLEEIVTLPLLKFALLPILRLWSFSVVALLTTACL